MGQLMFKDDQSLEISARYITHIIDAWNGQLANQIDEIQKVNANTAYGNRSEVGGQAGLGRQPTQTTPWVTERHG